MKTSPALARSGLVGSLAQEIATLIQHEHLQTGDRLPTVKALAARFGVAAPTVREAIQRLEVMGVVQVRHGAGIFVRSAQPRTLFSPGPAGVVDGQTIIDLLDTRLLIEPYLAEHAAQAAQGEQLARLAALMREAEDHLDGGDHDLQRANMAFHLEIARCAGNAVLAQVMELLVDAYASEQTAMLSIGDERRKDHEEHLAILAAIRAGDDRRARTLMKRHLTGVKQLMTARLAAAAHERKVVWLNAASGGGRHPTHSPRHRLERSERG